MQQHTAALTGVAGAITVRMEHVLVSVLPYVDRNENDKPVEEYAAWAAQIHILSVTTDATCASTYSMRARRRATADGGGCVGLCGSAGAGGREKSMRCGHARNLEYGHDVTSRDNSSRERTPPPDQY